MFLYGASSDITEAQDWITKCLKVSPKNLEATGINSALRFYQGKKSEFENLMNSHLRNHSYMRSIAWVFSLPKLPPLYFHRWGFFDHIIQMSNQSRPFYEFGVWRADSFKYLIKTFKEGYGFDTFEGLPEDWHDVREGTYSSEGSIPRIMM